MKRSEKLLEQRNEFIRRVAQNSESTTKAVKVLSRRLYISERQVWRVITDTKES